MPADALRPIRLAALLASLAALQVVVAFARQAWVVLQVGVGEPTDGLVASLAVPEVLAATFVAPLLSVLVPLLAARTAEDTGRDVLGLTLLLGAASAAAAALFALTARLWVGALFSGLSPAATELTTTLAQIQLLAFVPTSAATVPLAAQQARGRFVWAETAQLLVALADLAVVAVAVPRYGIEAAAWSAVGRGALQLALLLFGLGVGLRPRLERDLLREGLRRAKPLVFGTAIYKLTPLVDRALVALAPAGSLSLFYLAQQGFNVFQRIVAKAVVTPMVPMLSSRAAAKDWEGFHAGYRRRLSGTAALTAAVLVVVVVAGKPLLALFDGLGGITKESVDLLWQVLVALGGFLVFGAVGQVLAACFHARGDTAVPARVGVVGFLLSVPMKIAGSVAAGPVGIAVAVSAHQVVNTCWMSAVLRRFAREDRAR